MTRIRFPHQARTALTVVLLTTACGGDGPAAPDTDIASPQIALDATSLSFAVGEGDAEPEVLRVQISNAGDGALTGLSTDVAYPSGTVEGWLTARLDATTAPATVSVAAHAGELRPGTYEASVVVGASGVSNSPQSIAVRLTVAARPVMALSQSSVGFSALSGGADPPEQSVQVRALPGVLSDVSLRIAYDAGGPTGWLRVDVNRPTTPVTATLAAQTGSLPAGRHEATVFFESDESLNGSVELAVIFDVGDNTPSESFTLSVTVLPDHGGQVVVDPSAPSYASGTVVTLSVLPEEPFRFNGWSGDASGTSRSVSVVMDRDKEVEARFVPNPPTLSGEAAPGQVVLSGTFTWPCTVRARAGCLQSESGSYELHESTTSSEAGFRPIVLVGPTSSASFSRTLARNSGRYWYRLRAIGAEWQTDLSAPVEIDVEGSEPALPAPPSNLSATIAGSDIDLQWDDNATNEDGFRVHLSSRPDFSAISPFGYGANVTTATIKDPAPPSTLYVRVLAFNAAGESAPSNVVEVTTVAPPTSAEFVNGSSYPIYSIVIDGAEHVPPGSALLPGDTYTLELSPGSHGYRMANGYYDSGWNGLYTVSGSFTHVSGETSRVTFDDPTVRQLMTRFGSSRLWEGSFTDSEGAFRIAAIRFESGGTWTSYVDGQPSGSGAYTLEARNPAAFNVEVRLVWPSGSVIGTLWETLGFFSVEFQPGRIVQLYPS